MCRRRFDHYELQHNHWHVLLILKNQAVDERDYPAITAHAFNRFGPRGGADHRGFFPYGFTFREPSLGGPIDAFGFRIDEDLAALRSRPASHKVVAVLGGSSAYSWYSFHDETFTERLEQKLQFELDRLDSEQRVTVLNFGQGGAVVLHEMIVWLLHVQQLRPEIVISHDGFNDLIWGMTSDPFLLDHDICAPHIFEAWCRILHGRDDVPLRLSTDGPYQPTNSPRTIIRAYIERKKQLDALVHNSGVHHIVALQPHSRSKSLSPLEKQFGAMPRYNGLMIEMLARMPMLYDQVVPALEASFPDFFDLHKYFARHGDDKTLFQDHAHTTPAGDDAIADAYFEHILALDLLAGDGAQ